MIGDGLQNLLAILYPERYHGHGKSPPYFEGWYYKLVDASEAYRYAIIPGVYLGKGSDESHAFIQVLDGVVGKAAYHRFPLELFHADRREFLVSIGPNRFGAESINLDIGNAEQTLQGEVHFGGLNPWPSTFLSPGIMGWYSWVPFMECYHGVVSLDHSVWGSLSVDGSHIDWKGGRGYTEKDWGISFPEAWVWMQTNHFQHPGTSLTASVAVIPWLGSSFRGAIVGLWHGQRLYRFATYTGAETERLAVDDHVVEWAIRDRDHRLELRAERTTGGVLRGPNVTEMGTRVPETLNGVVRVRLARLQEGAERLVFEGTGRHAGLEVVGAIDRLVSA
jgi:hypothetical protein